MSDDPPQGPEKAKYINELAERVFARMWQEDAEKAAEEQNGGESSSGSGSGATTSGTNTAAAASTPATEVDQEEVLAVRAREKGKEEEND